MGKEFVLEMQARREQRRNLGLSQHFDNISVLGVYAQRKYQGQDLPEGWGKIESHIISCEQCQYDVTAAIDAIRTEDEAMMEVLFSKNS